MRGPTLVCALVWSCITAVAGGQTRDRMPVPDLAGYRTLKCDFHMHTVFSDGEVWPATRVTEAWRDGLDVLAITDHAGYHPHAGHVSDDLRHPYAIAAIEAATLGLILVPGVEFMEGNTHCNALFVGDPNAYKGLPLAQALRVAKEQNAFVFWNHPGWKQTPSWLPAIAAAHADGLLHGMELVNGLIFYPEAFPFIDDKQLTIFANSDVHAPIQAEYEKRTRPVTLVFAKSADLAGIREALFARRTAAWVRGELWGSAELLHGLWSGATAAENSQLTLGPGGLLRIRNSSAIPFKLRGVGSPPWLSVASADIAPESVVPILLHASKEAPKGPHSLLLEFEVENLHTAPGKNLRVKVPVQVEVP